MKNFTHRTQQQYGSGFCFFGKYHIFDTDIFEVHFISENTANSMVTSSIHFVHQEK